MKLIEDLGMHEYGTRGNKTRYGLYECPECLKHFRCATSGVTSGTTKGATCVEQSILEKEKYLRLQMYLAQKRQ